MVRDGDCMTNSRNGLPLKGCGRGVERTGRTEENIAPGARAHSIEQISGQNRCGAAAARAPAVDILFHQIEYQKTAIGVAA